MGQAGVQDLEAQLRAHGALLSLLAACDALDYHKHMQNDQPRTA